MRPYPGRANTGTRHSPAIGLGPYPADKSTSRCDVHIRTAGCRRPNGHKSGLKKPILRGIVDAQASAGVEQANTNTAARLNAERIVAWWQTFDPKTVSVTYSGHHQPRVCPSCCNLEVARDGLQCSNGVDVANDLTGKAQPHDYRVGLRHALELLVEPQSKTPVPTAGEHAH